MPTTRVLSSKRLISRVYAIAIDLGIVNILRGGEQGKG